MKYIPADKLRSVLQNTINSMKEKDVKGESYDAFLNGKLSICEELLGCIASLQQEQPEYGYLYTEYIHGKKPRWNVGDVLAYYISTSNEEGEYLLGKVSNVEFDNEEGWLYTFENEEVYDEQYLVEEGIYKKN